MALADINCSICDSNLCSVVLQVKEETLIVAVEIILLYECCKHYVLSHFYFFLLLLYMWINFLEHKKYKKWNNYLSILAEPCYSTIYIHYFKYKLYLKKFIAAQLNQMCKNFQKGNLVPIHVKFIIWYEIRSDKYCYSVYQCRDLVQ